MRCAPPISARRCCTVMLCAYNVVTLYAFFLVFRHLSRRGLGEPSSGSSAAEPPLYDDNVPTAGAALGGIGRHMSQKPARRTSHHDEQYWSQWKQSAFADQTTQQRNSSLGDATNAWQSATRTVEIWSTTGQGFYLWEHVLDGQLTSRLNGVWYYGEKVLGRTKFKFRGGRGIQPDKVPDTAEHVVLVLNGRSPTQIAAARVWLDALPTFERMSAAAVLLLGDERCANDWLLAYLPTLGQRPMDDTTSSTSSSSAAPWAFAAAVPLPPAADTPVVTPAADETRVRLKQAFLIYDSPLVDGRLVRQWPLGVATYRGFPKRLPPDIVIPGVRQYLCNFLGTVYENSTRQTLLNIIQRYADGGACYVKARTEWSPDESTTSMAEYVRVLRSSELTLCPVGLNSETYRIYEAMSMGSVPVVEDVVTPGECRAVAGTPPDVTPDISSHDNRPFAQDLPPPFLPSPYGILKAHGAPVIFVRDWRELEAVLQRERRMTPEQRLERRRRLVLWYADFLSILKRSFVQSINAAFFNASSLPDDPIVL